MIAKADNVKHLWNKNKQFIVFLLVGGINTLFGYSVFAFLIYLKLHYTLAALLSTIAGVIFNFNTFGRIVFKNAQSRLFLKFAVVYVIVYLLNIGLITMLDMVLNNFYINGAIAMAIVAVLTYFLNKYFVFKA